ncbi:hypothetical protein ABB37_02021 [Leptomonas pyrrhocoris]|uniref:Uncharacterized protein n=1 Tax=Leptomonas pyrrhocoris TaxID=157538 RepID=A0A0M9G721_LEPPY|nr:hypothetical protein ABB37_02021 [Leptomonas pyrrhocoris]XP_015662246.1 hypothetical protein ABB37_02021 [Leptomonas pyrrhocoris]XP_015662247.1 hypothetical protein ABB37_02021 [Leptomonas pyrrhocoris]KPA83806.1 hypothetical protein ABB37_02021 [Leptomonas pyrrhocoris]KPA83807.1 hypothetical protein ABB37_02021 [Leptomonas pyrrhocoris]KPA83808.1 hypothetical protein ABB37_02021 [Leptomonas pyrrhocoris]|eukprot:XP_015662245.1 hypothetical protein ABB37_02021 [Leptomonas pyrrhocoris]
MQSQSNAGVESLMGEPLKAPERKEVAAAGPTDEGHIFVIPSAAPASQRCGRALGICGWISIFANAINVVLMVVACYELHAYLIAHHPDDDAYALAGVAYLIDVPSLLVSGLMVLFVGYVLYHEYYAASASFDQVERAIVRLNRPRYACYAAICAVLFLISCWPSGFGLVVFMSQPRATSEFTLSEVNFEAAVWVAVSLTFAVFAAILCVQKWPSRHALDLEQA